MLYFWCNYTKSFPCWFSYLCCISHGSRCSFCGLHGLLEKANRTLSPLYSTSYSCSTVETVVEILHKLSSTFNTTSIRYLSLILCNSNHILYLVQNVNQLLYHTIEAILSLSEIRKFQKPVEWKVFWLVLDEATKGTDGKTLLHPAELKCKHAHQYIVVHMFNTWFNVAG